MLQLQHSTQPLVTCNSQLKIYLKFARLNDGGVLGGLETFLIFIIFLILTASLFILVYNDVFSFRSDDDDFPIRVLLNSHSIFKDGEQFWDEPLVAILNKGSDKFEYGQNNQIYTLYRG